PRRLKDHSFLGNRECQLSKKLRSFLLRDGCFSFRSALASICRMRSRVTENCWPTSSSVWSVFMPIPKRMRSTRSSRGVSDASTRVVVSRRFDWIAASIGRIAFLSSMKSPRCESSSSPIGVSKDSGSLAIFSTLRTFSSGMPSFSANSSGVGSRPISLSIWRLVRTILLMVSIMCTGMRMVRAWSAIERVIACRMHLVADRLDLVLVLGDQVLPTLRRQLGHAVEPARVELGALIVLQEVLAHDAVALGQPHQPAFVADQPLVDVVELLDQRVDARL